VGIPVGYRRQDGEQATGHTPAAHSTATARLHRTLSNVAPLVCDSPEANLPEQGRTKGSGLPVSEGVAVQASHGLPVETPEEQQVQIWIQV